MPQHQPFTALCSTLARVTRTSRADLHIHTTCSDGAYTPAEVVDLARRSGLAAVAITDHDTIAGIAPAQAATRGPLEIVSGVEITAVFDGRGLHLLGYFFRSDNLALLSGLARLRRQRAGRFREMVERLRARGMSLQEEEVRAALEVGVPGRRTLAELLVRSGKVSSVRAAFASYLGDAGGVTIPSVGLPAGEAIALVRGAGGVAAWAHPSYDEETPRRLAALRDLGLQAVEVDYPTCQGSKQRRLRALAAELGLAVTGGSDCHGPGIVRRAIGACGVTAQELETIRRLAF
ncbi:MAG TPA: PHP domain-containing protein [Gemmataceae bacterium]|nr:PHP domain-containing protein [Gemmataceae bacterium]